jgi:hypothetical protein
MKQKPLNEKQREVLERLTAVLKEAEDANVKFVYDLNDGSVTAFNGEGVAECYAGREPEDDDEEVCWDDAEFVAEHYWMDYFDSSMQYYYLKMETENE